MNKITCPFCNASIEDDSIFCDHCGKQLLTKLMLIDKENNIRLSLSDGNIIGRRSPETPQLATFASISGNHAQVRLTPSGNWTLTDKGSTNGTWVNNQRLSPETPQILTQGDIISFASLQFVVE